MPQKKLFDDYLSHHLGHVANPRTFVHRKKYLDANYRSTLPPNKDASLLDIGPGFGELLSWLHDHGYAKARGIDISREVVEHGNKLIPNSVEEVEDTVGFLHSRISSYERIYLFHVLEHVQKAMTLDFLMAIREALAPTGELVVEVPNVGNPYTGLAMRYADFTHEVGYTEASLGQVMRMAGFSRVTVFGPRVPMYSIPRFGQGLLQFALELIARVPLNVYQPLGRRVLTFSLGARASR